VPHLSSDVFAATQFSTPLFITVLFEQDEKDSVSSSIFLINLEYDRQQLDNEHLTQFSKNYT
jgi:hypothetical protein